MLSSLSAIFSFICIKSSSLAALSLDYSILRWLVLRFCCEMCGWRKNPFCMIAYHFLVLVLRILRWLHSQQRQCLQKSCPSFFSHGGPRSEWGHVCGHGRLLVIVSFCTSSAYLPQTSWWLVAVKLETVVDFLNLVHDTHVHIGLETITLCYFRSP